MIQGEAEWKVHCDPFCEGYIHGRGGALKQKIRGTADPAILGPAKFIIAEFS